MNDYKELIEELRNGYVLHENYNGEPEIIHRPSQTDKEAAAAIEQLVKERDKFKLDLYEANGVIEFANDRLKEVNTELDAYKKSFRIVRTDDERTSQAVFKMDYSEIAEAANETEVIKAISLRLAHMAVEQRKQI